MSYPKQALVGISGFLEKESRPSGIEDILWRAFSSIEHLCVCRFAWNESPDTIAKWVKRLILRFPGIEIHFVAYSYGGTTCERTIRALKGSTVYSAFLIDPVYRPGRLPSVRSLFGMGSLSIADNVRTCKVWRQTGMLIRGCSVAVEGRATDFSQETLQSRHTTMDNSPIIQRQIIERLQA